MSNFVKLCRKAINLHFDLTTALVIAERTIKLGLQWLDRFILWGWLPLTLLLAHFVLGSGDEGFQLFKMKWFSKFRKLVLTNFEINMLHTRIILFLSAWFPIIRRKQAILN
jgi:hypothetical protein